MCCRIGSGQVAHVTPHADGRSATLRLLRSAAAVMGEERAAQLRDALAERAAQQVRVGEAATAVPKHPPPAALTSPGPASMAAWERCREQIEALEGRLRAWAWQAPLAGGRGSAGHSGALDGYVVGVKDVIDVTGMPTRAGSPLTSSAPVPADAPPVARLRAAGAAIAGKTHCTEWALNDPAPTRNPWAPDRTPGGSSAGSAVAVAAGMCTATVDTQTAGDVLRPAAYNAVVGFKPTIGWVSTDGSQVVAPTIDTIGVTAGRVDHAAAVAAVIADDPARFTHGTVPGLPRLGVLTDPSADDIGPVMRANFSQTLQQLANAGATLTPVPCPVDLSLVYAAHRIITFAECAAEHLAAGPHRRNGYGPRARELIDLGMVTPAHAYLHAQQVRRETARRLATMFADVDVILLPVIPEPAPARATTGDSRLQIPWTMCGFPAVSLPTGLSPTGLPLAMQLIADRCKELPLLTAAHWSEHVLALNLVPPLR